MLPTGETISPRSKFPDQTASINISVPTSLGCLIRVDTRTAPDPQVFFEIAVPAHNMFKDVQSALAFLWSVRGKLGWIDEHL
jgi:hypothetical protein